MNKLHSSKAKSHWHNVEQKNMKQYYILHDSFYMTFKTKAEFVYGDRSQNSGYFWIRVLILEMFCTFSWVVVSQMHMYVRILWIVQSRFVYFTRWELCHIKEKFVKYNQHFCEIFLYIEYNVLICSFYLLLIILPSRASEDKHILFKYLIYAKSPSTCPQGCAPLADYPSSFNQDIKLLHLIYWS